ncbi:MAG: 23S rRNA (adenine(2503)-C(2))-methyltransferase RlmN [Deltaproteobacteria bacterium]|nr:23S rRNA (adenine(2503)-C(2))-methyltransferase RlmN [Deltaproteobacteria bacterium]
MNSAKTETKLETGAELVSALPEELGKLVESLGQPRYRGGQLFSWIQERGICDPDEMSDLPLGLRSHLADFGLAWPARAGSVLRSTDGTRKLEVLLEDGCAVETVLIPEEDKLTQCVSCQVGCAVGCAFCRSGHAGLRRNLTAAEIISQVQLARREHLQGERLRNIVFMGVGEPLHNLKALLRVLMLLNHPDGLNLSTRRVTVSTVGVVRGIDRLAQETEGQVALAVSLHAADDETRDRLVPRVSDTLQDIVAALKRYPLPKRRRFTIEYVLVKGINDSDQDAKRLVKLLSPLRVKVNLLPLNPHDRTDLKPPDQERVLAFQDILARKGLTALLRRRRGADIGAACGQLLGMGKTTDKNPV